MKIDRFIYSTNENANYVYCWPVVSQITRKLFGCKITLAFITNKNEKDVVVKRMKEFGEVILFKPIDGILTGNQAKVSRMLLATHYPQEVCVINDVDLIPLQRQFLTSIIEPIDNHFLVAIGRNAYVNSSEAGKFPMVYTTGTGEMFKDVINSQNLSYEKAIKQWIGLRVIDEREAINSPPDRFSDESLLRALILRYAHKDKIIYIDRPDFCGMRAKKRVDRSNWNIDLNKLHSGWYIDAHLPRPLNANYDKVEKILEFFAIDNYKIKVD